MRIGKKPKRKKKKVYKKYIPKYETPVFPTPTELFFGFFARQWPAKFEQNEGLPWLINALNDTDFRLTEKAILSLKRIDNLKMFSLKHNPESVSLDRSIALKRSLCFHANEFLIPVSVFNHLQKIRLDKKKLIIKNKNGILWTKR